MLFWEHPLSFQKCFNRLVPSLVLVITSTTQIKAYESVILLFSFRGSSLIQQCAIYLYRFLFYCIYNICIIYISKRYICPTNFLRNTAKPSLLNKKTFTYNITYETQVWIATNGTAGLGALIYEPKSKTKQLFLSCSNDTYLIPAILRFSTDRWYDV